MILMDDKNLVRLLLGHEELLCDDTVIMINQISAPYRGGCMTKSCTMHGMSIITVYVYIVILCRILIYILFITN